MKTVLVSGDVTFNSLVYLDAFPERRSQTLFSQAFHETVGGTAAGKALNLSRLGFQVTLHTLLGADMPGAFVRQYFAGQDHLTLFADSDPAGTQRHINLMVADGGRISIYAVYGTFEPEIDLVQFDTLIPASDYVVINISNYCRRVIPRAKAHGKAIWCDIHDYDGKNAYHQDFILGADFLFLSSDSMPDYHSFMRSQIAAGKQLVVCTHGREGAIALTAGGEWITAPALLEYPQVDTNGAGDSFFAGVLYGHAQGFAIERCLRLGAVVAGLCVTSTELFDPGLSAQKVETEYARHFGA